MRSHKVQLICRKKSKMNRVISCIFLLSIFGTTLTFAQRPTLSEAHREAMSKLDFLAGKWKGAGWMMDQSGQRNEFQQTENIQFKLDESILMIEGEGTSNGQTIHDALAIISYDPNEESYQFRSYLATGQNGDYKAELLSEKSLRWILDTPRGKIRYTINIDEEGKWSEIGEFQMGPEKWFQFFAMDLVKE